MDYKDELIKALQRVIELQELEIERLKQNQSVLTPDPYRPNPFWIDIKPPMYAPPIVTCETGNIKDGKQMMTGKEQLDAFSTTTENKESFFR